MIEEVQYFGYGANRDPAMMAAIIGREPEGSPAKLSGFELGIMKWPEIPEKARNMLKGSWDESFRSYGVRPTGNQAKAVVGHVWKITRAERRLIDNWELTGEWYKVFTLQYELAPNKEEQIEIQVIEEPIRQIVSGRRYKTFLNDKKKMMKVAAACREQYR